MVALEAFNRADDYLFGLGGTGSALVACLDAGWRPGLIGCSDEHGSSFGLAGRGRTGIWVHDHSREGVREALGARRTFATREVGLRLDATLDGVRMGGVLPGDEVELAVDLAGSDYEGRTVELQVLASATTTGGVSPEPAVLERIPAVVGDVTRAGIAVPTDAGWLLVRVADPSRGYGRSAPGRAPGVHVGRRVRLPVVPHPLALIMHFPAREVHDRREVHDQRHVGVSCRGRRPG